MLVMKLNVRNQRLNRYTSAAVIPNSYGDLKLQFNFITEDWKSVTKKVAHFNYKSYGESIDIDENGLCSVPVKIVRSPYFNVSVDGLKDNDRSIITNKIKIYVNPNEQLEDDAASGIVFVPSISEDKVLSWTIADSTDDIEVPDPVDLWPYDEWTEDETMSDYEWEEE